MRLSVIVPALDEAAAIAGCLASLAPLRAAGHEVIVVDGGSADDTAARARAHADRLLRAPRGRATQMNAGAASAQGDALIFLHADTRLPPDAAAAVAAALAGGAQWGRFDVAIDGRSRLLPVVAAAMNARSRLSGIATGDQAMFMRRDAFARAGGFPAQPLMEDIALSAALKRVAGPPACVRTRAVTSGRRWDTHGALRTIVAMWRLRYAYWRGVSPHALAARYEAAAASALPRLLVFAKEPVAGRVKTRLAAAIGGPAAAGVYLELAERTLAAAAAAHAAGVVGAVELWCDPAADRPAFVAWRDRYGVALHAQRGGDLGARMQGALAAALARGTPALLVGTDCPGLDVAYIARAAAALATRDAVLGPADDGGYVLIGLARDLDVFGGMSWSTATVMAATRARLDALGATFAELPPLWDVDTPADLARYRETQRAAPP